MIFGGCDRLRWPWSVSCPWLLLPSVLRATVTFAGPLRARLLLSGAMVYLCTEVDSIVSFTSLSGEGEGGRTPS